MPRRTESVAILKRMESMLDSMFRDVRFNQEMKEADAGLWTDVRYKLMDVQSRIAELRTLLEGARF